MASRIDFSQSVASELHRITGGYFAYALECLARSNGATAEEAVHEFRKTTKKLRAGLRLVSSRAARSDRRRWQRVLRNASAQLSPHRDFVVLEQNLRKAYESLAPNLDLSLRPWANLSLLERVPQQQVGALDQTQLDAIREALNDTAREVTESTYLHVEADVLLSGATESYRRGRRLLRRVEAAPTAEALHELRKRVKDQLYQLRLLASLSPKQLRPDAVDFDLLAELLGEYHDLAILKAAIDASRASFCCIVEQEGLSDWTTQRLVELERESIRLARRLYAESPKARLRRFTAMHGAAMRKAHEAVVAEPDSAGEAEVVGCSEGDSLFP